jgi:uncharacterized protein YdhG (YjbR/CyaY superfamily)
MARSSAATADDYIAEQEPARAAELRRVRDMVNSALPPGYVERMSWGMISWEVPLEVSGPTYNGQPLVYAALAAQKNHNALYLNCTYGSAERTARLAEASAAAGKKLDMGKSCVRFRIADDLPLHVLATEIGSTPPAEFVTLTQSLRAR